MKKRLSVDELQPGMYIAGLDRPWTDTPFLFQGFVLSTPQQLATLKKYCRFVYVDPERNELTRPAEAGAVVYSEKGSVEEEIQPARAAHRASENAIRDLFSAVRVGRTLDAQRVQEAISMMIDSALRNPDALLLLSQLKERSEYAVTHALDVSIYMITFGRFLQLERSQIELLGYLGLLQDVGKTRLPAELMEKRGRLTKEEYEHAKLHVNYSIEILRTTPGLPAELARLAGLHHEHVDGGGYPNHLQGRDIGMIGSIAAIADSFDAMTVRRPYAEALPPSAAISALYKLRGISYDADLVGKFIRCIGIFPVGSFVKLNSGETGIVIAQNSVRRLQPRVMVIQDAEGNALRPQKLLDLSRSPKATAGEPYRILDTLEYGAIPFTSDELFLR